MNFDRPLSGRDRLISVATEPDDGDDEVWPLDAHNGFLSHSKMEYVRNMRQVRRKTEKETEMIRRSGTLNGRALAR